MDSVDHANYVLFLKRQAVGVIEAKKQGTTLHGPPQAAARVQRAGAAAPADRHLLRAAREVQRVVLRAQTWLRDPEDQGPVDLRPAHRPALHAEAESADSVRPDDFVESYRARDLDERVETECFRRFTEDDLVARDKTSLDISWPREESLENTDNLLQRGAITAEIVDDLESALEEFRALAESLEGFGIDIEGTT